MRAVAVLAVIIGHGGFGPLPGGFIGVDVFFVVSGYLITRMLIDAAGPGGRVSLRNFYARRARRILPAASLVLVASVVGSVLLLNPLDALRVGEDALWAALFLANIRFAAEGTDYFALTTDPSPLQHYWSLAVEEQFYLVWPVVVAGCLWLAARQHRRGPGSVVARSYLALSVATLGTLSLLWSVYHTPQDPLGSYFSSLTRAWELAAGALVAIAVLAGRTLSHQRTREALAAGGLGAVLLAAALYDPLTSFPGHAALLPVLGTVALLWSGSGPAGDAHPTRVARGLAWSPMQRIGDWSYSLYLWHWPLLVIPQIGLGRELSLGERALAVAATFLLAWLTFRFVETPARRFRGFSMPSRSLALYPASLLLVLPVAALGWAWSDYQVRERGDEPAVTATRESPKALLRASIDAAESGQPIPSDLTPDLVDLEQDLADVGSCDYETDVRSLCRRGDPDGERTLVVTGDSHARVWIPAFEQIAKEAGYAAYYLVKPQCPAAFVLANRAGTEEPWPECSDFHSWVVDQVEAIDPDLVVVATAPPGGVYRDGELVTDTAGMGRQLATGFDAAFAAYQARADEVVLLADVPRLPIDPGPCLADPDRTLRDCLGSPMEQARFFRDISLEAAERADIDVVDPFPWMCEDDRCPLVVGSTITYRDRGHITTARSSELAEQLGRALGLVRGL